MNNLKIKIYLFGLLFFIMPVFCLAQTCVEIGHTKYADSCSGITCCNEGKCVPVENTAYVKTPTVKCYEKPPEGQECTDSIPCPYGSNTGCVYFKVEDADSPITRSKCLTSSELNDLNKDKKICGTNQVCETGTVCVKNDTAINKLTTEDKAGYCWSQALIDNTIPGPSSYQTSTATTNSTESLKEFTQSKPALSIPIPTIPGFSDIQVSGDEGSRYLDIPWIYEYVVGVYKFGITLAAALSILMIMIAGIVRIIAGSNQNLIQTANSMIVGAVTGMVILLSSYLMLQIINPKLINYQSIKVDLIEPVPLEFAVFEDKVEGHVTQISTSDTSLDQKFKDYATCINVDYRILKGIAFKESRLNPNAENGQYKGLFQVGKSLCDGANKKYNFGHQCSSSDRFDIRTNIASGVHMLSINLPKINSSCSNATLEDKLALIYFGHNLGPGTLSKILQKKLCTKEQIPSMVTVSTEFWKELGKSQKTLDRILPKINYSFATAKTILSFGATSLTPSGQQGTCPL